MNKDRYERGKVLELKLDRVIELNGNLIRFASIELDHINYGLDKRTKKLRPKKRSNFSLKDIGAFILLLDGEEIPAISYKTFISRHLARIDCPISGKFFGREFLIIFELNYQNPDQIYTLTLYPFWRKS